MPTALRPTLAVVVAWLALAPLPGGTAPATAADTAQSAADCNANGRSDDVDTSAIAFRLPRATVVDDSDEGPAVAADMDGDGDTDLVTTRPLSLHLNTGNARFAPPVQLLQFHMLAVAVADLDGDGDADIVAGNDVATHVFANLGGGAFAPPAALPLSVRLQQLTAADLDGDGDQDIIAAGIDTLVVLSSDGQGHLTAGPVLDTPFVYPTRLFTDDVDGDGDLDVLLGDSRLAFARNSGAGTLQPPQLVWEDGRGPAYAAGDLDSDGDLDLVAGGSFSRTLRIGRNDGEEFATVQQFANRGTISDLYLEDRDGDGDLDIVMLAEANVSLFRNRGDGTFALPTLAPALSSHVAVAGDFTGDGISDVATLGGGGVFAVLLGVADGGFVSPLAALAGNGPGAVVSGDFDGDGDPDLAVTNLEAATVSVIRNLGDAFSPPSDVPAGEMPQGIATGDLDSDGDLDLVVGHTDTAFPTTSDRISLLTNDGRGQFHGTASLVVGSAPEEVAIADLNGDSRPDIVAGGTFGYVALFLQQDGGFAARRDVPVGGISRAIAVGDIDRDRDRDLVVIDRPLQYLITLLRNHGDATFTTETLRVDADEPTDATFADVDGDGDLDLIVGTFYGRIVVGINRGGRFPELITSDTSRQGTLFTGTLGPESVGDIDGDGDPDLVMASRRGVLGILRNGGAGVFTAHDFLAAGSPRSALLRELAGGPGLDLVALDRSTDSVLVAENLTAAASSQDCDADRVPDECQLVANDCDGNAVPDHCQIDSDADLVPDACDVCAFRDDRVDADADRRPDCADNCPAQANPDQTDNDGDTFGDACDGCPTDSFKQAPGPCGCGLVEIDSNSDGVIECSRGCSGDCDRNHAVTVAELVRAVRIALGELPTSRCRGADVNQDRLLEISELVKGVQRLLFGCV